MSINNSYGKNYEIVKGPNRDRLIDAFKYAYDEENINLGFDVSIGNVTSPQGEVTDNLLAKIKKMVVQTISHEDGSGHSFNLKGYCYATITFGGREKVYNFDAYYNANTRKGTIRFRE
ncbi:hypothetical protein IKT18_00110 [Candidatus Saccharibacteria bacterium]|nr:hypothetical protein [Candidatus Saccharibacteria bacterium]